MNKKSTIFTAIAYANAGPHIGHAYEYVLADCLNRYKKLIGEETFFVTGMDEHGQKIFQKAQSEGKNTQEFVDSNGEIFKNLDKTLEVKFDRFIKTTDTDHKKVVQELWMKMFDAGDIYEKEYSGNYCIGCESYKTKDELNEKEECLIHLTKAEILKGMNWFFRLSKYQEVLKQKIYTDEINILPRNFKTEILSFIEQGLDDISFSRPKEVLNWGIEIPNDSSHVMYVWCDALTNYLTATKSEKEKSGKEFWREEDSTMLNIIGKDILRFHALYWPAMLISAAEKLPQNILVHGMILSNGHKMSKSLGNTVDPFELVNLYNNDLNDKSILGNMLGAEFFRYFFLKNISPFLDGDFSFERAKELYNADLANGIGNLVNRVMKLSNKYLEVGATHLVQKFPKGYTKSFEEFDVKSAFEEVFKLVTEADLYMQTQEPFKVIKIDEAKGKEMLAVLREKVYEIGQLLEPFMPETSKIITNLVLENKMPEKPLFPRYE